MNVPINAKRLRATLPDVADDPLYRAQPVGSSDDGRTSVDHDAVLYRG